MKPKEIACLIVACAVGIGLFVVLQPFIPAPTEPQCRDGWKSPSIGIIGACSHHGGVANRETESHVFPFVAASLLAGLVAYVGLAKLLGIDPLPHYLAKTRHSEDSIVEIISTAIEHKQKIEFMYAKRNQSTPMRRTIRPTRLYCIVSKRMNTQCVVGHCDLRNAERTFTVHRMKDVKLL